MENSAVTCGKWIWDDNKGGLVFISEEVAPKPKAGSSAKSSLGAQNANLGVTRCAHTDLNISFKETGDTLEKIHFRRHFQRRVKPNEPDVITIRDVKDVALFQTVSPLPSEFIDMFHTREVDRLLRALIVYMQQYIQTFEILVARRELSKNKLHCPQVLKQEDKFRSDLSVLRAVVAREYCNILLGTGNLRRFHHMSNKQQTSSGERDIRMFEPLYRISPRVVWIALGRHYGTLIDLEVNRLFRTDAFNIANRQQRQRTFLKPTQHEKTILHGFTVKEAKFSSHTPLYLELSKHHDYRMLGIGYINFPSEDPRMKLLQKLIDCPEEELAENGLRIGILGLPHEDFDVMLVENPKHAEELEAHEEQSFPALATLRSFVMSTAITRLPSIGPQEPIPSVFPRNNVPTPDLHAAQREEARIMWKSHMTHPK